MRAPSGWERLRVALRGAPPRWPIGEALHPLTLLAIVLLVGNDWGLKLSGLAPGLAGKLSDVAGLVAAPLVLSALVGLLRRRPLTRARLFAAISATGAVFVAVKASAAVAANVAAIWAHVAPGARIVADPTDLLTLPALALAAWIGADELRRVARERKLPS